jgi:ABC-type multidrug transport system ATPase subunit
MAHAFGIFTSYHVTPYSSIMTLYILNVAASGFVFGLAIPDSNYFGLPLFVFNIIICIGGTFIANDYDMSESGKLFVGFLFPQVSLNMGVFIIENFMYENQNTVMDYNWTDRSKPSLSAVNAIQIVSIFFYILISMGWPFRSIVSYMRNTFLSTKIDNSETIDNLFPCDVEVEANDNRRVFLDVRAVCHTYPDGTNAVRNMSFQVHEGEVLSFLGANGAGKSTTMGMLCGNLDVTSGSAVINGYNISTAKTHARRSLGICTQQDVIWSDLTVEEHLYIFAALRGLAYSKLQLDVSTMIASLGFPEKAKSLAGTLSGGQKRRLCAGISLIGGNKVVYLDEPTAGLDPVSRRQLWELIERNRVGRAILLTTHFMDEADVLGDRIAIVKEGRLRCIGSSKFLKENFGIGYLMRCSLSQKAVPESIFQIVKSEIPVAGIASSAGAELALRMPRDAVHTFPKLFETLEMRKGDLGILSFGIETTTLEEVFMRIINEDMSRTIANRQEANEALGADGKTYRSYENNMIKEASKSDLFGDSEIDKILVRGSTTTDSVVPLWIQVSTILHKRLLQCVRSFGQVFFYIICT